MNTVNDIIKSEDHVTNILKLKMEELGYITEKEKYILDTQKRIDLFCENEKEEIWVEVKNFYNCSEKTLYYKLTGLLEQAKIYQDIFIHTYRKDFYKKNRVAVFFILPLNIGYDKIEQFIKIFEAMGLLFIKLEYGEVFFKCLEE